MGDAQSIRERVVESAGASGHPVALAHPDEVARRLGVTRAHLDRALEAESLGHRARQVDACLSALARFSGAGPTVARRLLDQLQSQLPMGSDKRAGLLLAMTLIANAAHDRTLEPSEVIDWWEALSRAEQLPDGPSRAARTHAKRLPSAAAAKAAAKRRQDALAILSDEGPRTSAELAERLDCTPKQIGQAMAVARRQGAPVAQDAEQRWRVVTEG